MKKTTWATGRWWSAAKPEGWLNIRHPVPTRFEWEVVLAASDLVTIGYADTLPEAKRAANAAYDAALARLVAARGGA